MGQIIDILVENDTYPAVLACSEIDKTGDIKSSRVSFEIKPVKGKHFLVFKGKGFSHKEIKPKNAVVKVLRHYIALSKDFEYHLGCSETAQDLAKRFNTCLCRSGVKIHFVVPVVTTVEQIATLTKLFRKFKKEEAVLIEERLDGKFTRLISDRGESLQSDIEVLQAFCHFTYLQSKRSMVVCGLKGVRKTNTCEFMLTNPTIHSTDGRFGPKDKRDAGIIDFSDNHKCNKYCKMFASTSAFEKGSDEC